MKDLQQRSTPRPRLAFALALLMISPLLTLSADQESPENEPTSEPSTVEPAPVQAPEIPDSATASDDSISEAPDSDLVIVGRIDGEINLAESAYVKRLLEAAEQRGAGVLAIEMNTFGGRVDAAVAIRDALIDAPLRTVVFIDRRAISAGALISFACEKIAIASGGTIGAATPITSAPGQEVAAPVEEKYLSYFREEMRSTAETRGRDPDIAEAMVDASKVIEGVSEEGKLLTLSTAKAVELGIADVEAGSIEEALELFDLAGPIERLEHSWSEDLVGFLTSAPIASLLFLGMMLFAYLEYQTPGFGFFGFTALLCFLVLYFGHYMVNLAGWEELILFLIGVVLLVVEVFVLPGFGFAGVLGLLSILTGIAMVLAAGDWSDFHLSNPITTSAIYQVVFSLVAAVVLIGLLIRFLPRGEGALGGRLVLTDGLATDAGYRSHEAAPDDGLVDTTGVTLTPLRPAGRAMIEGQRLDVQTQGDFIDAGEEIRVVRRSAGHIVVRRA